MTGLHAPAIVQTLNRLHAQAAADGQRWAQRRAEQARAPVSGPDPLIRMGDLYIAVTREEGELLYMLARAGHARHVVEFGASFGISTLYLAAAARDTGGRVTTTEVHPDKCAALRETFRSAGVEAEVGLLEGDARETLQALDEPVDFVFLDGWKSQYARVLEILRPRLTPGAVLVADNISFAEAGDYAAQVRARGGAFVSRTIGDMEVSCFVG